MRHCKDVEKYNNIVKEYDKLYNAVLRSKSLSDYYKLVEYCKSVHTPIENIPDDVVLNIDLQKLPVLHLCGNKLCTCNVPQEYVNTFTPNNYSQLICYKSFDAMQVGCQVVTWTWLILYVICYVAFMLPICVLLFS